MIFWNMIRLPFRKVTLRGFVKLQVGKRRKTVWRYTGTIILTKKRPLRSMFSTNHQDLEEIYPCGK